MSLNLAGAALAVRPQYDCLSKTVSFQFRYVTAFFAILAVAPCALSQSVTTTVSTGFAPAAAAVNPVTNKLYVANYLSDSVTVIDGSTNLATAIAVGSEPIALGIEPVTNKIYVANSGSGTVTVIDGVTNLTSTVNAGADPVALAINSITDQIYVVNNGSGTVTAINGGTNSTSTIMVGGQPVAVALNPVTNTIYVANSSGNVTSIDGASGRTASIGAGSKPVALAVNSVTNKIYVANSGSNSITIINGLDNTTATVNTGAQPMAIAANSITNQIYVANRGSGNVSVIDGTTNAVNTVGVDSQPFAIGVNPLTNKIYVANENSANVTVIDGIALTSTSLATGNNPYSVAVNPVTDKIYVANNGDDTVSVIDGATNSTATTSAGSNPSAIAVDGLNAKVYTINTGNNALTEIDTKTNSAVTLSVGAQPVALAINPVTRNLYVVNSGSNNVTVIDGTSGAVSTVGVGSQPVALAVNPVTNKIYVANKNSADVSAIDGATNTANPISAGTQPVALAVNSATNKIYVANQGSSNLTVIDGKSSSTQAIAVGSEPSAVAVNPITNKVYVANTGDNTVTAVDGASSSTATVNAGSQPASLAVNAVTNKVYVANLGSSSVTLIDGATNGTSTIAAGNQPSAVAVNPATNKIYVTNAGNRNVTIIDGATNSPALVSAGNQPSALAIDSLSNKIYVANAGSSDLTVITEQDVQPIPLQAAISLPANGQAAGSLPSFSFNATSKVAPLAAPALTASAASSIAGVTPAADNVFYQVDTWQGPWTASANQGAGTFSGAATALQPGFHVLYAYATNGSEASATSSAQSNSPISNITGLGFLVTPSDEPDGVVPQSISFPTPPSSTYSPSLTIDLTNYATASSGLPVTYTLIATGTTGVGSLSGNILTVTQAGAFVIQASQAGNTIYAPAQNVDATLTVNQANQTITFPNPAAVTYAPGLVVNLTGDATSDSGLAVTYTLLAGGSGTGNLSGAMLTVTQAGTFLVQASQNGNADYLPAQNVTATVTVSPASQTITFPTPAAATYSPGLTVNLTGDATASSGLPITYTLLTGGSGAGTLSGTTLTVTQAGTFSIQASQSGNVNYSPASNVTATLTVNQATQTITFGTLSNQTYGAAPFAISASASSGLTVTFASTTASVCTVSGNTVTIVGGGACSITASQAGNVNYLPAPNVTQGFTVNQASQTITFGTLASQTYGTAPFAISASASSSLTVTFASTTTSVCTVSGNTVTIVGGGACSITASQAGNVNYLPAPNVTQGFTVNQASQTITFGTLASQNYGAAPFAISASASSGLSVTFASTTTPVCTVSGSTVTLASTGTCSITASQAGNANYSAAPNVMQSFTVNQASQTITFSNPGAQTYGVPLTLSATASSGLTVTFASNSTSICTVSGNTASFISVGNCSITASQAGNANYSAASSVTQIFAVNQASQTITFGALSAKTYGGAPFTVSATASSGLTVSFSSTTTSVCTVSGSTVTIVSAGSCSIVASQSGNANYLAAPNVTQSFTVNQASQTITFGALANKAYGAAPFAITATASSGLTVTFSSNSTPVCTVSGNTVTLAGVGTCSITASQAGNTNYAAAPNVTQTFTVGQGSQTITFGALSSQTYGASPFTISATASSGLTVSFSSTTTAVCTVSGSTVTILTAGTCSIVASQAGNADYSAATNVTQSFTVNKAATTTTASNGAAMVSQQNQTVTLTAMVTSPAGTVNEGTVTFTILDGTIAIGVPATSPTVVNGSASAAYTIPGNTAANNVYTIQAVYNGSGNLLTSSDSSHTFNLSGALTAVAAQSTAVTFSPNSQSITLSAAINAGGASFNGGTVTFSVYNNQGQQIGSSVTTPQPVSANVGTATYTLPANTPAGVYAIYTSFSGVGRFAPSTDTSGNSTLTVNTAPSVTTGTSTSATYSPTSQGVAMTASVTASNLTVNAGSVTFSVFNGGSQIGSAVTSGTVSGGTVGATYSLPGGTAAGTYSIHAVYNGSQNLSPSSDTTKQLTVLPAPTVTVASNVPVTFSSSDQTVTLSASITSAVGAVNGGTVNFTILTPVSSSVTSGTVSNGGATASFVVPGGTAMGNYTIQAVYSGAGNFASSTDTAHSIIVTENISQPLMFVPMTPCRIVDTRPGQGFSGQFGPPQLAANSTRTFSLPDSSCGIPSAALAYSVNLTVVPISTLGYLTVWPTGQSQPLVSTLNSLDGRIKANAAIVPAGTNGSINVYVTDATQFILDIDGYFMPANTAGALAFYPLAPCRVVDTRGATGPLGGPSIAGGTSRSFPMQSACNIPSNAQAYSLNFTAVPSASLLYLTVWPTGESQPTVSTLNDVNGVFTANAAIVPAGTNGYISVYASDTSDVVIDVNGYFAPPGNGGLSLYTLPPCRVIDTRNPPGSQPFNGTLFVNVAGSACGVPSTAEAYVFNATVVPPGYLSYLTLWPDGQSQPYVSTLNATDGAITSNMAIVPTSNGSIDAFGSNPTQLILDISSFFAP